MTSTLIVQYMGQGVAASRPATPSIDTGAIGFYYATDTSTLTVYANGAWNSVGGGLSPGSPPTVVQHANNQTGNSVTFGVAPTNGNMLVCICFNPSGVSPNTGWTQQNNNSSGLDFGSILTKVAGAGESTTQQPISTSVTTGGMVVWEVNGQNSSEPIVQTVVQGEQAALQNSSPAMGLPPNCLFLGACGLSSASNNNNKLFNVTQDVLDTTGSGRQMAAGHSTLANAANAQILVNFTGTGTPASKAFGILLTS